MRKFARVIGLVCGVAFLAAGASAQDKPAKKDDHDHGKKQQAQGEKKDAQPSDQEAQMMEMWMKMASPGEQHAILKSMEGKWSITGKFRMAPEAPWEESKSESTVTMILGGRFLKQEVKGEPMMGMETPFEGFGLLGYDNQSKKHTSVWMDNMGTMTMIGEGEASADGKTISYMTKCTDPMTNQPTWMKTVYKIEGPDKYTMTMSGPDAAGKEFVMMELTHTRKK